MYKIYQLHMQSDFQAYCNTRDARSRTCLKKSDFCLNIISAVREYHSSTYSSRSTGRCYKVASSSVLIPHPNIAYHEPSV